MLVATVITLLGLLAGIAGAHLYGLRLGGVVVTPLAAVYFLREFESLPVFILGVVGAYAAVTYVKPRWLLYGRRLFVFAVLVGAVVPVAVFVFLPAMVPGDSLHGVAFVGSVLPGIAAYNFHRLPPARRAVDVSVTLIMVALLSLVGIGLVAVIGLTPFAGVFPAVLLSPESDIATALDLAVVQPPVPAVASTELKVLLATVGLGMAETIRRRYGFRIGGLVVLPILLFVVFRNRWLLLLWTAATVVAYLGITGIQWWTLIYGRALLAMAVILGLFVTIALTPLLPIQYGLLAFFVGLFAGVVAYNIHVVPPADRQVTVVLTAGVFATLAGMARLVIQPVPEGFLAEVTLGHSLVGVFLLGLSVVHLYRLERQIPSSPLFTVTPSESIGGVSDQ